MINSIIVVSVLFLVMIVSHYAIKKLSPSRQSEQREYQVVCAGLNDGQMRPLRPITDISNMNLVSEGVRVRISDYVPFVVEGESMSTAGIHSEDIVLVKVLTGEDRLHLKKDNIIAFTYEIEGDNTGTKGYKLRQFIDYIVNINTLDAEKWCEEHNIIIERARFIEKYEKAKARVEKDSETYICSKTWHNGGIDYSFHSIVSLYGKVEYCIPRDKLK